MTVSPAPRKRVHIIDNNEGNARAFVHWLEHRLRHKPLSVQTFASIADFYNAVPPDDMPDAIVTNNRHDGMTGVEWAAKLRREGYRGKFYILTGSVLMRGPAPEGVDAVYEKAADELKLINAIDLALFVLSPA